MSDTFDQSIEALKRFEEQQDADYDARAAERNRTAQDTFDRHVRRVVDALRRAADEVERAHTRFPTVVHPITGNRRQAGVAAAMVRTVTHAVTEADLGTLVNFASEADLEPFPQTQEL